jgi:hypothetical protein
VIIGSVRFRQDVAGNAPKRRSSWLCIGPCAIHPAAEPPIATREPTKRNPEPVITG